MEKERLISTTQLSRALASFIDEVRFSGQEFFIKKGSKMVATLSPPPRQGLSAKALVNLLEKSGPLYEEKSFSQDLELIRKQAKLPKNSWR